MNELCRNFVSLNHTRFIKLNENLNFIKGYAQLMADPMHTKILN